MPAYENDKKDAFDLISISSENSEPLEDAINNNAFFTDENITNSIEEVSAEKHDQFRDDDADSLETSSLDIMFEDLLAKLKRKKLKKIQLRKLEVTPMAVQQHRCKIG